VGLPRKPVSTLKVMHCWDSGADPDTIHASSAQDGCGLCNSTETRDRCLRSAVRAAAEHVSLHSRQNH